jgi:hypothetical protein
LAPDQAPEAVQPVALVADQFNVALPPVMTALGPTLKETVGAGPATAGGCEIVTGGGGVTVTGGGCVAEPPLPMPVGAGFVLVRLDDDCPHAASANDTVTIIQAEAREAVTQEVQLSKGVMRLRRIFLLLRISRRQWLPRVTPGAGVTIAAAGHDPRLS